MWQREKPALYRACGQCARVCRALGACKQPNALLILMLVWVYLARTHLLSSGVEKPSVRVILSCASKHTSTSGQGFSTVASSAAYFLSTPPQECNPKPRTRSTQLLDQRTW